MKLTVTEAMTRLKMLDKRITDKVNSLKVAAFVIGAARPAGYSNNEDFVKDSTASLQSANALIDHRDKIKRAVVNSNTATRVKIGSAEMSVAEAIEQKSSISYRKALLEQIKGQYTQALQLS